MQISAFAQIFFPRRLCPSSKQDECVAAVHVTQLKGDRKAVSLAQMWACGSVRTGRPRDASATPAATCVRVMVGGAGPTSARSLTGPLRLAPRHKPGMFIQNRWCVWGGGYIIQYTSEVLTV